MIPSFRHQKQDIALGFTAHRSGVVSSVSNRTAGRIPAGRVEQVYRVTRRRHRAVVLSRQSSYHAPATLAAFAAGAHRVGGHTICDGA
jgi:hypothetical protein